MELSKADAKCFVSIQISFLIFIFKTIYINGHIYKQKKINFAGRMACKNHIHILIVYLKFRYCNKSVLTSCLQDFLVLSFKNLNFFTFHRISRTGHITPSVLAYTIKILFTFTSIYRYFVVNFVNQINSLYYCLIVLSL